ncbi:MAG: hypothetical protein PHD37_17230 [Gallionellaceae bacterium]|nr:hypothetical protein [Gallionellaceae bacterium]
MTITFMSNEEKETPQAGGGSTESHGDAAGKGTAQAPAGAESSAKEGKAESEMVSRADYLKLQADLDNFKRIEEDRKGKEKRRQEELLKEQGKFRELYETDHAALDAAMKRLEAQDAAFKAMLEDEMKDLPETFDKTLIPAGAPYDQLVWLRKAKPAIAPKAGGDGRRGDGTPPAKPVEGLTGMRGIYNHPTSPKH